MATVGSNRPVPARHTRHPTSASWTPSCAGGSHPGPPPDHPLTRRRPTPPARSEWWLTPWAGGGGRDRSAVAEPATTGRAGCRALQHLPGRLRPGRRGVHPGHVRRPGGGGGTAGPLRRAGCWRAGASAATRPWRRSGARWRRIREMRAEFLARRERLAQDPGGGQPNPRPQRPTRTSHGHRAGTHHTRNHW